MTGRTETKVLVLGMGNSILSDDSIGLRIVDKLRNSIDHPRVGFDTLEAGGLEVLDVMTGFDHAIVVDAITTGDHNPGDVLHIRPEQFASTPRGRAVHDVSFADALELGRRLNLAVPGRIDIFAIEVADSLTVGDTVSPDVAKCIEPVIDRVVALIEQNGIRLRPAR